MANFPLERSAAPIYINDAAGVRVFTGSITTTGKAVAIKEQVYSSLNEANAAIREGFNMAKLRHPGICEIHDCYVEEADGGRFKSVLVVELMATDLMKRIDARKRQGMYWTEAELMGILVQLVDALAFAEEQGICHRDIKPQNIFITEDERVAKIGDFGSAKGMSTGQLTSTLAGSPLFLSPQLKSSFINRTLGVASSSVQYNPFKSDVYSLGVTFAFMGYLSPPSNLIDFENIVKETEAIVEAFAHYPMFQWYLGWMLKIEEEQRPDFVELRDSLAQHWRPQVEGSYNPAPVPEEPQQTGYIGDGGYTQGDYSAYPSQHSEYQKPAYCNGESVQNQFSLPSAVPEPQLYSEMAPNSSFEAVSIPASSQPSNIMGNLPQCVECKRYFSGTGQYCGLMCKQQVKKREQAKAVTLPAQSSKPHSAQNPWFPDQKPEESKQPNRPPATGTQDLREESKSIPGNFDTCVWCKKSLTEHRNTAISLLCRHKFHDSECVLLYLKEISCDFRDKLSIKCPQCMGKEENYSSFIQKAFKSMREFIKRREKHRNSFCVVCRKTQDIAPYNCGHMFCPYHMETSTFCGFCKELKEYNLI